MGGYLDENGIPSDLRFTESRLWLDLLQNIPPYYPVQTSVGVDGVFCGNAEVSFDDHLGEIALPILYVGAGGGFGEYGYYTTTLTSSNDVMTLNVQLQPEADPASDFGHADTVLATNAKALVWWPILDWIMARAWRGQ